MPFEMRDPQAVIFEDKLIVGGGWSKDKSQQRNLGVYDHTLDQWSLFSRQAPTQYFGIAVYRSKLSLLGGELLTQNFNSSSNTSEIAIWDVNNWQHPIPPMNNERSFPSACAFNDYLVVSGGFLDGTPVDIVEVFNGEHWFVSAPLPKPCTWIKSSLSSDGILCILSGTSLFYCQVEELISTEYRQESEPATVWKPLPELPYSFSSIALFGNSLISVGGLDTRSRMRCSQIRAYFHRTRSWLHIADAPCVQLNGVATVLPTGELFMAAGETSNSVNDILTRQMVYKGLLKAGGFPVVDQLQVRGFLRGVNRLGHTKLTVQARSCSCDWDDYGFKLHIPHNSLPSDAREGTLKITASSTGAMHFPEDTELVSGVFWIKASTKIKKPATVEIEHCAIVEHGDDSSALTFVVANCAETSLPYHFDFLSGGHFHARYKHGTIALSHFCGLAIVARKRESGHQSRFSLQVYYTQHSSRRWTVDLVVTKDLKILKKGVQGSFGNNTTLDYSCTVRFETDEMWLEIPRGGIEQDGWEIRPKWEPMKISRRDVKSFKLGSEIPKCSLQMLWKSSASSVAMTACELTLAGTSHPRTVLISTQEDRSLQYAAPIAPLFRRTCSQGSTSTVGGQAEAMDTPTVSVPSATLQMEPELSQFTNKVAVKIAHKWRALGIQLGLQEGDLQIIQHDKQGDAIFCCVGAFDVWKRRCCTEARNWGTLLGALESGVVDERRLAHDIRCWLCTHTELHAD